ncbi:MAG: hypothetical protein H7A33_05775 [Deltaproteobacteria bacterium]|nr:hypothetical protein [Deltaproteobacteria bacterium]
MDHAPLLKGLELQQWQKYRAAQQALPELVQEWEPFRRQHVLQRSADFLNAPGVPQSFNKAWACGMSAISVVMMLFLREHLFSMFDQAVALDPKFLGSLFVYVLGTNFLSIMPIGIWAVFGLDFLSSFFPQHKHLLKNVGPLDPSFDKERIRKELVTNTRTVLDFEEQGKLENHLFAVLGHEGNLLLHLKSLKAFLVHLISDGSEGLCEEEDRELPGDDCLSDEDKELCDNLRKSFRDLNKSFEVEIPTALAALETARNATPEEQAKKRVRDTWPEKIPALIGQLDELVLEIQDAPALISEVKNLLPSSQVPEEQSESQLKRDHHRNIVERYEKLMAALDELLVFEA